MVALLYLFILTPLIVYVITFIYETYLAIMRVKTGKLDRGQAFVMSTWEISHTIFVYAVTVFIVSHADLLPIIAPQLLLPSSIFIVALIIRGTMYLSLFYADSSSNKKHRLWHALFALTYITGLLSAVWLIMIATVSIITQGFVPNTDALIYTAAGFIPALLICGIPIFVLYRHQYK